MRSREFRVRVNFYRMEWMNRISLTALLFAIFSLMLPMRLWSQSTRIVDINWEPQTRVFDLDGQKVEMPSFQGAYHEFTDGFLPHYLQALDVGKGVTVADVQVQTESFAADMKGNASFGNALTTNEEPAFSWKVREGRGRTYVVLDYVPIVRKDGAWQKISKFKVSYRISSKSGSPKSATYVQNSVLASGQWYRIGLTETGIYRMGVKELEDAGVNVDVLNPQTLNVFGSGYGQLPLDNSVQRPDDLPVNAIFVSSESGESFGEDDYILFYGRSPNQWSYDESTGLFDHHKHEYTDTSYYFIGINTGVPPKRIAPMSTAGGTPTQEVRSFNDYVFHEVDRENLIKSGRQWFGEKFDIQTVYNFSGSKYTFPNILPEAETVFRANFASRTTVSGYCSFTIEVNGAQTSRNYSSTGVSSTSLFATGGAMELSLNSAASALNINISYTKNAPSAMGWLDWFNINTRRQLKMFGAQMSFRDAESFGPSQVSKFIMSNATGVSRVWEVTDPTNAAGVQFSRIGSELSFVSPTDELKEFIAFTGSSYLTPSYFGSVANQNLHALGQNGRVDLVIVAPGQFMAKAEELAEIHRNHPVEPLNVEVVRLQNIYNEFSSGMRDITAIKWLMKMLYDRANGNEALMPRYLTLFGDGSYDNRNIGPGNTNFIPTYQSSVSLSPVRSYVSDDYFGLLSDDDGDDQTDVMDIGVGRLVVKNITEANSVVNKIRRYVEITPTNFDDGCTVCTGTASNFGSWRNVIALVADDEDNNTHMSNARVLSSQIESYTRDYNLERIFIDAFPQVATPGGARYPAVNQAIDRRVRNGAFIVNYTGHGGELGWAQERILDIPTILAWDNAYAMPVFMTATCEFTRFDDPLRTSAGEHVLLNGNGGGIALLTTTRLVYSGPNFTLNQRFYDALFNRPPDEVVTRLGDIYRTTKNNSISASLPNHRNFSLIGDPALPLALPEYKAEITSLTDTSGTPIDTLKALGVARVKGRVINENNGQVLTGFSGRVQATVFDRVKSNTTLANDGGFPFVYPSQESVIYRGNAEVINGEFSFDFVLPKDISFAVDTTARISLYAFSTSTDATGYADNLTIGGRDENAVNDGQGPDVKLYLNDDNFVFGGYTNNEPILVADIFDPNGVNTVGNGIGHDITAVVDDDVSNAIVLNDYYESDLNTFKSGRITFPFEKLEPGSHSVKLKVWDVHNNSGEAYTEFIVADNEEFTIERVLNYPNPFTTHTEFYFEHNQSCSFLNVLIEIYTVSGRMVKSINTVSNTDGFRNEPIAWDGRDDFGDKLATGVYVYKVSVRNPSGDHVEKFEKLVVLN